MDMYSPIEDKRRTLLKKIREIESRWMEHFADSLEQSRSVSLYVLHTLPRYPIAIEQDHPPSM